MKNTLILILVVASTMLAGGFTPRLDLNPFPEYRYCMDVDLNGGGLILSVNRSAPSYQVGLGVGVGYHSAAAFQAKFNVYRTVKSKHELSLSGSYTVEPGDLAIVRSSEKYGFSHNLIACTQLRYAATSTWHVILGYLLTAKAINDNEEHGLAFSPIAGIGRDFERRRTALTVSYDKQLHYLGAKPKPRDIILRSDLEWKFKRSTIGGFLEFAYRYFSNPDKKQVGPVEAGVRYSIYIAPPK